jgi:hypothetical protein
VVTFPGWDAKWVEHIPRKSIQVDPDPNRRPIAVPPGALERWREEPAGEGTRISGSKDGFQG